MEEEGIHFSLIALLTSGEKNEIMKIYVIRLTMIMKFGNILKENDSCYVDCHKVYTNPFLQRLEDYKSSPCKSRKSFIIKGDPSEMIVEGKSSVSRKWKTLGNLSRYDIAVDNITDEESTDMEEEEENDREGTKKQISCSLYIY